MRPQSATNSISVLALCGPYFRPGHVPEVGCTKWVLQGLAGVFREGISDVNEPTNLNSKGAETKLLILPWETAQLPV